jgi:hypothetical protein
MPKPLLYSQPANRAFFDAAKGLIECLRKLDKPQMATEIIDTLLQLDSSNPLGLCT